MKKLTAKEALKITIELWEWLAENPAVIDKAKWPGWEKYGESDDLCTLCDYRFQDKNRTCDDCLIYWRKERELENACVMGDTPFTKWCFAETIPSRKKYALEIVKLAKDALENLQGGK